MSPPEPTASGAEPRPLPMAPYREEWAVVDRAPGAGRSCDLLYRVQLAEEEGPEVSAGFAQAMPLLMHEFDRSPELRRILAAERWQGAFGGSADDRRADRNPRATLRRILPRLLTFRYLQGPHQRELVLAGVGAGGLHVLSRVLETGYRFRLEDLSHFATHGELLAAVLHAAGMSHGLDPDAILYAPTSDSPYPFKFVVAGRAARPGRVVYLELLRTIMKRTEQDEVFRARVFRELARGYEKFGPAAATPAFQEVELRTWRLLGHLAARLRVKAGRLTDAREPEDIHRFLRELRDVHAVLDDLGHLPSRLAAFFRTHFDAELATLAERALDELDGLAARVDCDLLGDDRSVDAVAARVSEFRRLGSASPLETLDEKARELELSYGDVDVPAPLERFVRSYSAEIFTGAAHYDARRYADEPESGSGELSVEELELDVDVRFGFGG